MAEPKHILSESMFKAFLVIILSLQGILSARTVRVRINVTRQTSGDILLFDEDKIDCVSLNAACNNGRSTKPNECKSCKCVSRDTTYVSTKNRCINADDTTIPNCQIYRQIQTPVLNGIVKASVSRIIRSSHCEIRQKNPQVFSVSGNTGSWTRMKNVDFVLESRERRGTQRVRNWLVKFQTGSLSSMLSKYPGRIANLRLRCIMGRNARFTDLCIIFKIAGSVIRNFTVVGNRSDSRGLLTTNQTILHTTNGQTTQSPHTTTTDSSAGQKDEKTGDGKNNHVIWITISVLVVVIIVLVAIICFICVKKRKEKESNVAGYRRRDGAVPHNYDVSTKSALHDVDDHVYATIPETRSVNPSTSSIPTEYQELNAIDREIKTSHYQALVHPELDYIDVIPDPEQDYE